MDDLWSCKKCNNPIYQEVCPYCFDQYHNNTSGLIACWKCTFQNQLDSNQCQCCGEILKEQNYLPHLKPSYKSSINCPHCGFQNALDNMECLSCTKDLYEDKSQGRKKCDICTLQIKSSIFDQHYTSCLLSKQLIMSEVKEEIQPCMYCGIKFQKSLLKNHLQICDKKPKIDNVLLDQKTRMTKLQIQAIKYMHQKAAKEHAGAKSSLQKKIKKLGFKNEDLQNLHFYIQNYAPIIIHIHVSKHMQFFVKDTHYRSQFETNKSSGSLNRQSRTTWQDRMFDKRYSLAKDSQRVKYGTINFTNDPKGVKCCVGYGPSYFLLKDHVRQRCTFTDKDSSNNNAVIGTFKFPFKVLDQLSDPELKAALEGARAMQVSSNCVATYKQIQIHGPIQFAKDIQRIYVSSAQIKGNKKLLDMVYQFSKNNKVDHDFI